MTQLHSLVLTLLVGLGLPLCARADLTNGLIFHAGFDQDVRADVAKGNAEPIIKGNVRLVEGARGKAVQIGDSVVTSLDYENEGNFFAAQGSLAFWMQPVDWLGKQGKAQVINLFMQGRGSSEGYFGLEMERFNQPEPMLIFYTYGFPSRKNTAIRCNVSAMWTNGGWYHVVLTWVDTTVKLYVDGELAGSGQLTEPFTEADIHSKRFTLGDAGEEHTSLDEFRIWNRPLDATEIMEMYRKERR
ncbi:MAG: LamG domain-containing protein [Verrucomicrobiae bacterium]|nr:LamG domain-containing protein [Verrucomicrobiae bacterium]